MTIRDFPIAIIGAGPVGMAAAAHLVKRNIPFMLFEAGNSVGSSLLEWGHVRVFSPWKYNIDKAAESLLKDINWSKPDEDRLPTGKEIVKEYLLPLSFHPDIEPHLHLNTKVISITRRGLDKVKSFGRDKSPFIIRVSNNGMYSTYLASGIIDASGTWYNPNPIGAGGVLAIGESEASDKISYRIPDILGEELERYANKTILVVGGGHSAINSLLDLASLRDYYPATKIHWSLLATDLQQIYGGKEDDALKARGSLGIKLEKLVESGILKIHTPYYIHEITKKEDALSIKGFINGKAHDIDRVDQVIANTGARPDISLWRELRVQYDAGLESVPELAELIDPNIHSCGTVRPHGEAELRQPEPNFYVVGVKSYGRAPTFLMATGYEQVRSITAYLDGDLEAAQRVELDLPETGVCSSDNGSGVACCGSTPEPDIKEEMGAACCSPSANNLINNADMKQEEKLIEETVAASGCCGGAPTSNEDACCKLDEEKKAEGDEGCGCSSSEPKSQTVKASSCC